jgi:tetratricopeptide (TPR) repeat protein
MNVEYARLIEKKAICAAKLDDQSAALKSHTEALKIYRTVHGTSHPFVKNSLYNIGLSLNSLGKPEKARKCLQQAYKATKNLHGEENIDCAEINFHIGISYKLQENFTAAKNYFDDSINTRKIFSDDPKCLAKSFEMAGDVVSEHVHGTNEPRRLHHN